MFRHQGGMVGPPKTLYDLRKVEASVRVTCRACGAVKTHDLEELIHSRSFHRESMDWVAVQHDLICSKCDAPRDVDVAGVPFGANDRELRAQRAQTLLMNLALKVLDEAARRAKTEDVCTPAVRLALRVLRPFLADRELLVTYWTEISGEKNVAFNHGAQALRWIVFELVKRGHSVWAEFR